MAAPSPDSETTRPPSNDADFAADKEGDVDDVEDHSSFYRDDDRLLLEGNKKEEESAAVAVDDSKGNNSGLGSFKLMLLALLVLQNCSLVLVARYTRSSASPDDTYSVNHLLVVIETFKLFLSALLEHRESNGKLYDSLRIHVWERPLDAAKILVPALLYLVQNGLLFLALSNLTAPLFQVTYQGKLVTTALVSVLMLQRSYSLQQWICLIVLSLGVAVVVLEKEGGGSGTAAAGLGEEEEVEVPKADGNATEQNVFVGLVAVGVACFSSALAGVYFEKVLKKPPDDVVTPPSLWMRNMQLAFFSVVIAVAQGFWSSGNTDNENNNNDNSDKPYFHGFTAWVWTVVLLQAAGGLLIAAVIKVRVLASILPIHRPLRKSLFWLLPDLVLFSFSRFIYLQYADNVLKGLATAVSVVVSTVLSTLLFRTPLSVQFVLGSALILGSVYVFSNPVPVNTGGVWAGIQSSIPLVGSTATAPITADSDGDPTQEDENTKELKPLLPV